MALTIGIEGKGIVAYSSNTTDTYPTDQAGGTWANTGGGTTAAFNPDVTKGFNYSVGCKYPNKDGEVYYDIGTGNELDFTAGTGTESGQFIYVWLNIQSTGQFDILANNGLVFKIGSGTTSNYLEYDVASDDDSNGWTGGWKCFVIDPTKTPRTINGTQSSIIASLRYLGIRINSDTSVRADSIFIGPIFVGNGLRITGTSTSFWYDLAIYTTITNAYLSGVFDIRGKTAFVKGKIYIGTTLTTGSESTSASDSGRAIEWEKSEFYNGTSWVSGMPTDASGIVFEDSSVYSTTFTDGVIVGTDNGRSGSSFTGNNNENVSITSDGIINAASDINWYGSNFKSLYGGITGVNDPDHVYYGCSFVNCQQFNPVGASPIRNCTFAETISTLGSLLWNENINIRKCSFIANTAGAAIEHRTSAGSPYDYFDLIFSGNTFDGNNTSGVNITINNNGTSDAANDTGANTITYLSSSTLTLLVKDETGSVVSGAYAYIDNNNITPFIMNTTTNASGIASVGYTGGAVTGATWRVRKYGYKPFRVIADIPASGTKEIPVTLIADPQQT